MSAVKVKRNDIGVTFTGTLTLTTAADWTGATVRWLLKNKASYETASGVGSFTGYGDGTVGESTTAAVSYATVAGNLAKSGVNYQEWEVTFADGSVITFPSDAWNTVTILDDLSA
jgi:hypothetical protein